MQFEGGVKLAIEMEGALIVAGNDSAAIVFEGSVPAAGHWDKIDIESASDSNVLSYVRVSHGGSDAGVVRANVRIHSGARLKLAESTLTQSAGEGLRVETDGTWPATDAPYRVTGDVVLNADVTVSPGAGFVVESSDATVIETENALIAIGTAGERSTFLGEIASAGHWDGLDFRSADPSNQLSCVEVA
ncbi:MAG: hypothetical protein GF330_11565 [Candidatus Eisenbacteria bacterium]|nr:hypothetical protein [Candidatus Eisenbacteria bacterium]